MRDNSVDYTYERTAALDKPFEQDECDACWAPIIVSKEAAFIASTKILPNLLSDQQGATL